MANTLVEMVRVDGTAVSEVHGEGFVAKPDRDGVVLVPSAVALTLIAAGYWYVTPRNSAQTNNG
jgi:hypothetical protein